MWTSSMFGRMEGLERALCRHCNRAAHWPLVERLFTAVSRLGNGVFWYALMLVLPLKYGTAALAVLAQMVGVGVLGLLLYRALKRRLLRPRPFMSVPGVRLGTAPLDQWSFPSGHTLHAVAFSAVAIAHFPALAWVLVPFTVLVALSRVILGLHYPSDVLAGAALGGLLAGISFAVV